LAWTGRAAEDDARRALTAMEHAADEGLDPERYRIVAGGDAVARDIALSAALLQYMRDLSLGRVELEGLDSDVALPGRFFDAPVVLEQAWREGRLSELLAGLAPGYPDYMLLKGALARYPDPAPRDSIIANMERWRWLPIALEPYRIVVLSPKAMRP
jgi:murein L,D-transpeptidase YcbB/YkuD